MGEAQVGFRSGWKENDEDQRTQVQVCPRGGKKKKNSFRRSRSTQSLAPHFRRSNRRAVDVLPSCRRPAVLPPHPPPQ